METFTLAFADEKFENSAIYNALTRRQPKLLLRYLQRGDDVTIADAEFHTTFLHVLLSDAKPWEDCTLATMVYLLSNAGVDVNAQDYSGRNALDVALDLSLVQTTTALLRCGCDDLHIQRTGHDDTRRILQHFRPGLRQAILNNDSIAVDRLVRSWCRIRASRDGQSLIRLARDNGSSAHVISSLEQNQSTVEYVHAALAGDEQRLLELLPNRNINLGLEHPYFPSLLHTAVALHHVHLTPLLTSPGMKAALETLDDPEMFTSSTRIRYQNISRSTTCSRSNSSQIVHSEVCIVL